MAEDPLSAQAEAILSAGPEESATELPLAPPRRLYAIGDIHLSYKGNEKAWDDLRPHPFDGLILAGDVGETIEHLELAFQKATSCFKDVFWCPGNHELYTLPSDKDGPRGELKYKQCVATARAYGVLTPEDPYTVWDGDGGPCLIAPTFTLYDYSFRPDHITLEGALDWAKEEGIMATDERLLHPNPYKTRQDWCAALIVAEEAKLERAKIQNPHLPLIIINHWPLREDLVDLMKVPRFSIWCGTKKTKDWHTRYNAKVVVSGHLHVRRTDWMDGVRFEECSLGYPRQWKGCLEKGFDVNDMLREILPGPAAPPSGNAPTQYRIDGP
ncbi:Metallo-dependent phosphatase [Tothia fuscella]|uniref:Metallo-dependent phosphatase n=1 Tax=Tothia fuscella TaxID=1048955 RepID=A0A9P4NVK1_9PEZI|nr:Metallo-dependent phosphatase [Tothia fuscella]